MPDLEDLTIGRWCSFVWWWLTDKLDHTDVQKFKSSLWMPPKGVAIPAESPWSVENETKAFAAFKAGLTT